MARTWNGQGGLISTLSDFTEIDTSAAVAVLCVESRGKGFGSDGRIIIRFDFIKGSGTTSPMIEALQRNNFEAFASYYNGPGQAAQYGHLIANHFEDFNDLMTA